MMTAPEDPTASGSARPCQAVELPEKRAVELPEKLPPAAESPNMEQPRTMEDQIVYNYRHLTVNMHMTRQQALETLFQQAQNDMEREAIQSFAEVH